MMTNVQLLTYIQSNLTDDRLYGIQLYLDRLVTTRQRVNNSITNTPITLLADLQTALTTTNMDVRYNYESNSSANKVVPSFYVTFTNVVVNLDHYVEDDVYTMKYGIGNKLLQFEMSYLSDGDTVLPIKIFKVNLVDPMYY